MTISFSVTGCAAHSRISPLLPTDWEDVTSRTCNTMTPPSLLWENAPRHETKDKRDGVRCYSHLPNGTDVLDSKWALARFMCRVPQHGALATLETYCFRGRRGFDKFWKEHYHCPHFETTQEYSSLPDLVLDPQPTTAFPAALYINLPAKLAPKLVQSAGSSPALIAICLAFSAVRVVWLSDF